MYWLLCGWVTLNWFRFPKWKHRGWCMAKSTSYFFHCKQELSATTDEVIKVIKVTAEMSHFNRSHMSFVFMAQASPKLLAPALNSSHFPKWLPWRPWRRWRRWRQWRPWRRWRQWKQWKQWSRWRKLLRRRHLRWKPWRQWKRWRPWKQWRRWSDSFTALAKLERFVVLKWHRREAFVQVHRIWSSCIVKDLECTDLVRLKRGVVLASLVLEGLAVSWMYLLMLIGFFPHLPGEGF